MEWGHVCMSGCFTTLGDVADQVVCKCRWSEFKVLRWYRDRHCFIAVYGIELCSSVMVLTYVLTLCCVVVLFGIVLNMFLHGVITHRMRQNKGCLQISLRAEEWEVSSSEPGIKLLLDLDNFVRVDPGPCMNVAHVPQYCESVTKLCCLCFFVLPALSHARWGCRAGRCLRIRGVLKGRDFFFFAKDSP